MNKKLQVEEKISIRTKTDNFLILFQDLAMEWKQEFRMMTKGAKRKRQYWHRANKYRVSLTKKIKMINNKTKTIFNFMEITNTLRIINTKIKQLYKAKAYIPQIKMMNNLVINKWERIVVLYFQVFSIGISTSILKKITVLA